MHRIPASLLLVLCVAVGCATPAPSTPVETAPQVGPTIGPFVRPSTPTPAPSATAGATASLPEPGSPLPSVRPSMPEGFPVPDGAEPALIEPDDQTTIGHWYVPQYGYDLYNFYVDQLPRAGYPIEGVYPGETVAIIRFDAGDQILQVYMTGSREETDLVLRTDVP